ncbi:helix-turn-helix transcriptional regulator [Mycolicibacterium komossense]|uniref:Helix-turn-helix domain-containing protein n=1 Tax=Mycolicibacterium komossense TaxID=1779 RepID=A0ABT3C4Y1_9MYCO|nr:helix-turn-helix domain-containing protein [Mycolicibacterium komossense]MCV7224538.1 helix-turn-helix domain-containing protein [Mycolicibacterium komossense]
MAITAEVELMTTEDVSTELGIPVGTLRYYRSTGSGPMSFRLAGRVRYRRAEVMAWVNDQERATRRGEGVA